MYRRAAAIACRLTSHCLTSVRLSFLPRFAASSGPTLPSLVSSPQLLRFEPGIRSFCTLDVQKEMDTVNQLFAEAREEIEFAKEEAETVYFNDSVTTARKAVETCMSRWEGLLAALSEEDRNRVIRTMGLKIAQLQAEFDEVSKLHLED